MFRIIPRLDIKGQHLIKGVHLEGLRKVGNPNEFAFNYYNQGADELIYMDAVASLYGRNSLTDLIKQAVKSVFIPITVGGGIRSVDDAIEILRSGADKVAVNTAATMQPELINKMVKKLGSQSVTLSIEAKRTQENRWEVYTDNGREKTGKDVKSWAIEAAERGIGEILLTSIDYEGTKQGFDLPLIEDINKSVGIPIIASGGYGQLSDSLSAHDSGANAVAIADALHFNRIELKQVKEFLSTKEVAVRPFSQGKLK